MSSVQDQRDYNAAITTLNSLQTNFSTLEAIRGSRKDLNRLAIPEMREYFRRLGYRAQDLERLNAIHVAGTKGKGSTSSFVSSMLYQYVPTEQLSPESNGELERNNMLKKVGLYTSPHLQSVRERIQINNEPLSETAFANYFFETYDRLKQGSLSPSADFTDIPVHPMYFRFLTLMMFHTFLAEGVDTAIIECGIGGEYDSTNILERPIVAAVTSLGIDHVGVLGETIEDIAWHKAGIFKASGKENGATVFTVASQPSRAMAVLEKRAAAKSAKLVQVPLHPEIENGSAKLGLAGEFQKINASLAVALAAAQLRALGFTKDVPEPSSQDTIPKQFRTGLLEVKCGGRCEVRHEGRINWHLDGGHTLESIKLVAEWFASCLPLEGGKRQKRVLFFNQQTRDASALATALFQTMRQTVPTVSPSDVADRPPLFTHAFFSTNMTFAPSLGELGGSSVSGSYKPDLTALNMSEKTVAQLKVQKALAETWKTLDPPCAIAVEGTIEEAVRSIRAVAREDKDSEVMVLVTGSIHLVGGVLEVLETRPSQDF